jgi:hypothetical protein
MIIHHLVGHPFHLQDHHLVYHLPFNPFQSFNSFPRLFLPYHLVFIRLDLFLQVLLTLLLLLLLLIKLLLKIPSLLSLSILPPIYCVPLTIL